MIGKIFKVIINLVLVFLICIGILAVISFLPISGNFKLLTVQSGSMEPAIHTGSLIFVKPMADYSVGDVITRQTDDPKISITHRVIAKEEVDGKILFETKGDANNGPDGEKFAKEQIIGKEVINLPYIGYPVGYAKTKQGLILIIVIPAVIIIYDELNKILKEMKRLKEEKKAKKEAGGQLTETKLTLPEKQFARAVRTETVPGKKRRIV